MLRRVTVGLAVAVFLAAAIGLVVVGPDGGDEGSRTQFAPAQTDEFDNTVFRIQIREDGDVRWTIEHERILDDDEEESQFREFAETFRNEETEAFRNFRTRAGRLIEQGSDATGREMAATEFERDAYVDPLNQASGIIEMSFRWENFSQVDGERVFIGDVFDGGWGIVENQRLTIQTREQLVFQTVEPEPDSMTVTGDLAASESVSWIGERQITDERPRVVMVPPWSGFWSFSASAAVQPGIPGRFPVQAVTGRLLNPHVREEGQAPKSNPPRSQRYRRRNSCRMRTGSYNSSKPMAAE
jgi:hypothetical protein